MHINHLLHILHLAVHGKFEPSEDARNHLGADVIIVMERPSGLNVPPFAAWFSDIMEQGGPPKPQVVGMLANIINHLQGMIEIVFMRSAVPCLHDVHEGELGQDKFEQSTAMQFYESPTGVVGHHDFVQLVGDTFATHNLDAFPVALQCLKGFILDEKLQLCGETHAAHHAQWIVREGDIRVERCANDAVFQV